MAKKKPPNNNNFSANEQRYEVVRDTREKTGWWFPEDNYCLGTVVDTLPTGDYSIRGMEALFVIERKKDLAEFSKNITEARFDAELERLESFRWPFLIINTSFSNIKEFPVNSGIPLYLRTRIKIKPAFILSKILDYQIKYKTKIILAEGDGEKIAARIFSKINKIRLSGEI